MSGAVARLVREYAERRGLSPGELAQRVGWSRAVIVVLLQGERNGSLYLGTSTYGRRAHGRTLLAAVARELQIPRSRLLDALAIDLGIDDPAPRGRRHAPAPGRSAKR